MSDSLEAWATQIEATRSGVGLFEMPDRGVLEVSGSERVRWLDGMISGDVAALDAAGVGAGCYATLLTNRGAIVADLHVGNRGDVFWLESKRSEIGKIKDTLERFIIADDVTLSDRSDDYATLALEGPAARPMLVSLGGPSLGEAPADSWGELRVADADVVFSVFGFSGLPAFQLRMAPGDRAAVEAALLEAGGAHGILRGSAEALEIMRIEAGIAALGAELDEEVLPAEARLEHAISIDKGCYVGQEIVARVRARGQVNHLLVGLRFSSVLGAPGPAIPEVGAALSIDGRKTGEITSVCLSPSEGGIGLGYVRREHAEPGTRVEVADPGGVEIEVAELPFRSHSKNPVVPS